MYPTYTYTELMKIVSTITDSDVAIELPLGNDTIHIFSSEEHTPEEVLTSISAVVPTVVLYQVFATEDTDNKEDIDDTTTEDPDTDDESDIDTDSGDDEIEIDFDDTDDSQEYFLVKYTGDDDEIEDKVLVGYMCFYIRPEETLSSSFYLRGE